MVNLLFGDGRPVWTQSIPGTWPSQPLEAVDALQSKQCANAVLAVKSPAI